MALPRPKPPFPNQEEVKPPPGLESKLNPPPQFQAPEYHGANKLKGKVALITGGDSGIGRSVAVLYAREAADVAIVYLPEEESDAQRTGAEIEKEGRQALLIPGDITNLEFCEKAIQKTIGRFGHLDILVNNAAFQKHVKSINELTLQQWDKTFKTNIYSFFYLVKAAIPHLKKGAVILNTSSIVGLEGSPELLDYAATKGAINAFTKSLALQLVKEGIRVNCVAPGPVWTPLNPAERDTTENFGAGTPMGRPAQPEEIAPAYVFLASAADSSYISGEVLTVLGGKTTAS